MEMLAKAMPIKPSGAKFAISKPVEYCEAAPMVWFLAYDIVRNHKYAII